MRHPKIIIVFGIFLLASTNCVAQNPKGNSVELIYVVQPMISKMRYTIKFDSITVTNLRAPENTDSVLYKSALNEKQISSFYNQIRVLKIDTLGQYYEGSGFDGFDILLKINTDFLPNKVVGVHNYIHPTMKAVIEELNILLSIKDKIKY